MSARPEALAKPGGHQRQLFVTDAVTDRELALGEIARQGAEGVAHLAATLDGNDVVVRPVRDQERLGGYYLTHRQAAGLRYHVEYDGSDWALTVVHLLWRA
jgi:hypothetical protein